MSSRAGIVAGRYAVGELLGEGAFAFTYRAHDIRLGRDVALKILREVYARDTSFTARFTREAVAIASISHRNVVQIYDHGPHEDTLYIAMEYVDGRTLRQVRLEAGGRLPVGRAVELIVQVLRGLRAVHRAGIIHRDIKPENILVGHDGVARLADFGIATDPTGMALTMTGTTLGTAAYMAPEQARGEPLTPAADLYSVGVVLFELLAGRLPFRAENAVAMMLAHQQLSPPSFSQTVPEAAIPAWLEAIVQATLAKSAGARFSSALEMEEALLSRADPTVSAPVLEHTTQLPAVPRLQQPHRPAVAATRPVPRRKSGGGRGWLLAVALLAVLAGSVLAAAWWSGRTGDDNSVRTPTPRAVEFVTDDLTETPEPAPTEEPPTSTLQPEPTESTAPIVPIATDTAPPVLEDTITPTAEIPEVDLFDPGSTATIEDPTRTPGTDGDSPTIEPVAESSNGEQLP